MYVIVAMFLVFSTMSSSLLARVSCGVCMGVYDREDHAPKILPCQHTFCSKCLSQMKTNTSITCPVCRKVIPVKGPDALSHIPTNMALLDVTEEIYKSEQHKIKCAQHPRQECLLVCVDCTQTMCILCMKHHMEKGAHIDHNIEDVETATPLLKEKLQLAVKSQIQPLSDQVGDIDKIDVSKVSSELDRLYERIVDEMKAWRDAQRELTQSVTEAQNLQHNAKQAADTGLTKIIDMLNELKGTESKHVLSHDKYVANGQVTSLVRNISDIAADYSSQMGSILPQPSENRGDKSEDENNACKSEQDSKAAKSTESNTKGAGDISKGADCCCKSAESGAKHIDDFALLGAAKAALDTKPVNFKSALLGKKPKDWIDQLLGTKWFDFDVVVHDTRIINKVVQNHLVAPLADNMISYDLDIHDIKFPLKNKNFCKSSFQQLSNLKNYNKYQEAIRRLMIARVAIEIDDIFEEMGVTQEY